ncbi:MAG: dihydrodipicolinate synthase family protein [Pirellulales bacterium]
MAIQYPQAPEWVAGRLADGQVIPAHPLALTPQRKLDETRQCELTRYYHASGAGGVAVGVHTTQFAIRSAAHQLLEPVLRLAGETVRELDAATGRRTVLVAGVCGSTDQAVIEAELAARLGYHAGLLSLGALATSGIDELLVHARAVAERLPLFGFYLQPAAGGRILPYEFWRKFVEIPNVVAIKVAPFNRYQTWDVVRAVGESERRGEISLYTGNDDSIVADLVSEYRWTASRGEVEVHFAGGLLGHWACWTHQAVRLLRRCQEARRTGDIPLDLLRDGLAITDMNGAIFDARHQFAGCIPGIHEILCRQGLLQGRWCLDPDETLSPGQAAEIDRVCAAYPWLVE